MDGWTSRGFGAQRGLLFRRGDGFPMANAQSRRRLPQPPMASSFSAQNRRPNSRSRGRPTNSGRRERRGRRRQVRYEMRRLNPRPAIRPARLSSPLKVQVRRSAAESLTQDPSRTCLHLSLSSPYFLRLSSRRLLHPKPGVIPPPLLSGTGKPCLTFPKAFRPQLGLGMGTRPGFLHTLVAAQACRCYFRRVMPLGRCKPVS